MEGQNRVAVVVFAGEQRRKTRFLHALFQLRIALLQLRQQTVVVQLSAHLNEGKQVVAGGEQLFVAVDLVLQLLGAHLVFLGTLQIVPEALLMSFQLQPLDLVPGRLDLKRLVEVFKGFVHGKQFLLISVVFDHCHMW